MVQGRLDNGVAGAGRRLLVQAPMLRVALAMAVGIGAAEWCGGLPWRLAALAAVAGVGVMVAGTFFVRARWLFVVGLWGALIATGMMLWRAHLPKDPLEGWTQEGEVTLSLCLDSPPRRAANSFKVEASVDSVEGQPTEGRIMLFVAADSLSAALEAGDRLRLRAAPRVPSGEENPFQFNYRRYLRHRGMLWQCYVPQGSWQRVGEGDARMGVRQQMGRMQQRMVRRIRMFDLSPRQQGMAEALLLGWRGDVDEATERQFRQAGITHLLCVSGLHVGILAAIVGGCLFFLGRRRWQRVLKGGVQVGVVWLYVLLTGMAPSTLRAGVMFTLMIVGGVLEQRPNTLNNLATSAVVMFCLAPMQLFDVGFQLSYAAVLGIVAWHRPLVDLLPALAVPSAGVGLRLLGKVWSWVCLSTSAQLATLPLVLHYFHQFPTYFLIANLTIVPFAGVLLASMLVMMAAGGAGWSVWLMRGELQAVDALTQWVSGLPSSMVEGVYFDWPMVVMLAAALVLFALLLRRRWVWAVPAAVGCLVLMAVHLRVVDSRAQRQQEVVVYRVGKHLAMECCTGRASYLVCDRLLAKNPSTIDYQRSGWLLHHRVKATTVLPVDTSYADSHLAMRDHVVVFEGKKIWVLDHSNAYGLSDEEDSRRSLGTHWDAVVVAPYTPVDTLRLRLSLMCDTFYFR